MKLPENCRTFKMYSQKSLPSQKFGIKHPPTTSERVILFTSPKRDPIGKLWGQGSDGKPEELPPGAGRILSDVKRGSASMPFSQQIDLIRLSRGQDQTCCGHQRRSMVAEFTGPKQAGTWIPMAVSSPPLASHPVGQGGVEGQLGSLALAS